MNIKMPRGAFATPRSELAASEPYQPEDGTESFYPCGVFPSPNQELAASQPYRGSDAVPESFLAWPTDISYWGNDIANNSTWAEEAFAKACAEPKVLIPTDVVLTTAQECGASNFAWFMRTHGFQMDGNAYLDGPVLGLNWTNTTDLHGAIAEVGPVKIGIASANLESGPQGQITPGTSGWAISCLPTGQPENQCASLCGYGSLAALVDLFKRHAVDVNMPSEIPSGLWYAMFFRGSIGILDRQSLMNITGEAWVRNPTTIVSSIKE
jgi:hypothetical protein